MALALTTMLSATHLGAQLQLAYLDIHTQTGAYCASMVIFDLVVDVQHLLCRHTVTAAEQGTAGFAEPAACSATTDTSLCFRNQGSLAQGRGRRAEQHLETLCLCPLLCGACQA